MSEFERLKPSRLKGLTCATAGDRSNAVTVTAANIRARIMVFTRLRCFMLLSGKVSIQYSGPASNKH